MFVGVGNDLPAVQPHARGRDPLVVIVIVAPFTTHPPRGSVYRETLVLEIPGRL